MPLPGAQTRPEDRPFLEPWANYFYQACASAFTSSYLASAEGAPFATANGQQFQATLLIHLVEKALYELLYELDNRPLWAELPLRGLLSVLDEA
jgi:maltose alpha-D-glucosyltransferase/alpha-amylase